MGGVTTLPSRGAPFAAGAHTPAPALVRRRAERELVVSVKKASETREVRVTVTGTVNVNINVNVPFTALVEDLTALNTWRGAEETTGKGREEGERAAVTAAAAAAATAAAETDETDETGIRTEGAGSEVMTTAATTATAPTVFTLGHRATTPHAATG